MSELLTAADLAGRLKVTRLTVLAWHRAGRIPGVVINARCIRFHPDRVMAALEGRQSADAPAQPDRPRANTKGEPAR